jgi:hypothetical protein
VQNSGTYNLDEIKALPKKDVVFAMECSGNSGFPWFEGGAKSPSGRWDDSTKPTGASATTFLVPCLLSAPKSENVRKNLG